MSTLRNALQGLPRAAAADWLEGDDAYLLVIDLPGATAETTEIRVEDGRLRSEAQREKAVPPDASTAEAHATLEAGVLELELPRLTEGDGTTIPIEDD